MGARSLPSGLLPPDSFPAAAAASLPPDANSSSRPARSHPTLPAPSTPTGTSSSVVSVPVLSKRHVSSFPAMGTL